MRGPLLYAAALIGAAALLLVVVIVLVLRQGSQPAGSAGPDSIEVAVTTTPVGARVLLDDAQVGHGPYSGFFPRDNKPHRIRAEASNYAPRTEIVTFDKPRAEVNLTLVAGQIYGSPPPSATAGSAPRSLPSGLQTR
jgi:hypothetical protein